MKSLLRYVRQTPLLWIQGYWIFYFIGFFALEQLQLNYTIIRCPLDDYIPFHEAFIIPYCMWYIWMYGAILLFFLKEKEDYLRLCFILFAGMTIALICYVVWPNGLDLREPVTGDNIFCDLVRLMRVLDTPTNVCPSIHISSTVAIAIVGLRSKLFRGKWYVKVLIWVMTVLITLSTVSLKQHSVVDVFAGIAVSVVLAVIAYRIPWDRCLAKLSTRAVSVEAGPKKGSSTKLASD